MSRDLWVPTFVLLTCEHGGRDVPAPYAPLFRGVKAVLDSHRGYDIGALGVAHRMAAAIAAPIVFSTVTRLLVDVNRSLDHAGVFSEFSRDLPEEQRAAITARFYTPHRESVSRTVAAAIASGHRVLHAGVHSYADALDGERREFDVALLFDPARPNEVSLCKRMRAELRQRAGDLRYRFNEPYRGADDGLTTTLREAFPGRAYAGIEIEVRQGMVRGVSGQRAAGDLLAATLAHCTAVNQPTR